MMPVFQLHGGAAAWIVYVVVALATTYVISLSTIGYSIRRALIPPGSCTPDHPLITWLATGLYCPTCTSWWVGFALGALHYFPITCSWTLLDAFVSGCFTMVLSSMWFAFAAPGSELLSVEHPEMFLQEHDNKTPESEKRPSE